MKSFITKIAFVFALLLTAASVSAASFDPNPALPDFGYSGVASINDCGGTDCGNQTRSLSYNQIGSGNEFTVFLNFKNNSNGTISSARGNFDYDSTGSSTSSTITATLSGAGTRSGNVSITNLPNNWEIEFVEGEVYVQDRVGDDGSTTCSEEFPSLDIPRRKNINSPTNISIGPLTYSADGKTHEGWCDQGYAEATFTITDTTTIDPVVDLEVETQNHSNINDDSVELNGRLESGDNAEVWFVISTSSSVSCSSGSARENVSGSYDSGDTFDVNVNSLNDDTRYYYRACAEQDNETSEGDRGDFYTLDGGGSGPVDLDVITRNPSSISENDATLNGEITDGETNYVYFVWGTSQSGLFCSNTFANRAFPSDWQDTRTDGDRFDVNISPLSAGNQYHYRACASNSGDIAEGEIESFYADENISSLDRPDAETEDEDDVDENSAELNGNIDMNDVNDGEVFFVWGQDQSDIEDTTDENRYADLDNDGDDFQKEKVEDNFDGEDDFDLTVNGLDADETYYYRICVEYKDDDNDDQLECGEVERFDTDDDDDYDDDDDDNDVEVQTDYPQSITQTTAEMCGELVEDGGSSQQTWFELRPASGGAFTRSKVSQRREGDFCERVSRLSPSTSYLYRACTKYGCASAQSFRTLGASNPVGTTPIISTLAPTNIRSNSAKLNSYYIGNGASGRCWFNYGRNESLGKRSNGVYNTSSGAGSCNHNFTGLASGVQYCVQAVIETQYGTDTGSIQCFTTPRGAVVVNTPVKVTIVKEDKTEIDLLGLGLGLSLVRLEIDNDEEVVTRGENVEYLIEWENISELDLKDLKLEVSIPPEIQITDVSRGDFDANKNKVYFIIDRLDGADFENNRPGENGSMTVSGIVGRGTVGNTLSADANMAYDNPINDAQENAQDFDWDEYGVQVAGVTASVFGLANITFLGWLVIVLGLFIIFLVARWLYLEREEMRAQAYLGNGYGGAPRYNNGYAPLAAPSYQDPAPRYNVPPAPLAAPEAPRDTYYEPYQPNRG
jgi:hypothetical protein